MASSRDLVAPGRTLQGAFSDGQDAPAFSYERIAVAAVPGAVAGNLCAPEVAARLRHFEQRAVVAMPEAAMDKDCRAVARENHIRAAGKVAHMQPEAQTRGMQATAKEQLGRGEGEKDR